MAKRVYLKIELAQRPKEGMEMKSPTLDAILDPCVDAALLQIMSWQDCFVYKWIESLSIRKS